MDVRLEIHFVNTGTARHSVLGRTDTNGTVTFELPGGLDGEYDLVLRPRAGALLPISWKRVALRSGQTHVLHASAVLEGDTDLDGVVGPRDIANFIADFAAGLGRPAGQVPARSDFDHDGLITIRDFSIIRMGYRP